MADDPQDGPNEQGYDPSSDDVQSLDGDVEVTEELQMHAPEGSSAAIAANGPHHDDHVPGDNEEASVADSEESRHGGCSAECREEKTRWLTEFNNEKDRLVAEIDRLNREVEMLTLNNSQLRGKKRNTTKTWPTQLEKFLKDRDMDVYEQKIYPLSCMEENMSPKLVNIHPNLRLRPMNEQERKSEWCRVRTQEQQTKQNGEDAQRLRWVDDMVESIIREAINAEQDQELFVPLEPPGQQAKERLARNIQALIIRKLLEYQGKLVHCISRLDPHTAPATPAVLGGRLLHRFHIGSNDCSITAATRPDELLQCFKVNKFWYFVGAHAFYGLNTFAFSSLGEFGRFSKGIGEARRQRIQNVEILWIGSQKVCFKVGEKGDFTSRRTWFVHWLTKMPRLQNLVVHLDESSSQYIRRGHESLLTQNYMAKTTQGQPNYRRMRCLRTLQGLDFICALRGMKSVLFYDFNKYLQMGEGRHFIRDWTFYMDVENQVKFPKSRIRQEEARLENLAGLGCPIDNNFLEYVRPFYADQDSGAFDLGQDVPRNITLQAPGRSDSDSDSDNDRPPGPNGAPQAKGSSIDKAIVIDSDSDSSSDSESESESESESKPDTGSDMDDEDSFGNGNQEVDDEINVSNPNPRGQDTLVENVGALDIAVGSSSPVAEHTEDDTMGDASDSESKSDSDSESESAKEDSESGDKPLRMPDSPGFGIDLSEEEIADVASQPARAMPPPPPFTHNRPVLPSSTRLGRTSPFSIRRPFQKSAFSSQAHPPPGSSLESAVNLIDSDDEEDDTDASPPSQSNKTEHATTLRDDERSYRMSSQLTRESSREDSLFVSPAPEMGDTSIQHRSYNRPASYATINEELRRSSRDLSGTPSANMPALWDQQHRRRSTPSRRSTSLSVIPEDGGFLDEGPEVIQEIRNRSQANRPIFARNDHRGAKRKSPADEDGPFSRSHKQGKLE